jgi:hypothetical protein
MNGCCRGKSQSTWHLGTHPRCSSDRYGRAGQQAAVARWEHVVAEWQGRTAFMADQPVDMTSFIRTAVLC